MDTINQRIVSKVAVSKIVAEFPDLAERSVYRHKDTCLRELYASVIDQKRVGLLATIDRALNEIDELKRDFPDNPNVRLGIVGKLLDAIDREAKLTGAYIKDAINPADATQMVERFVAEYTAKNDVDKASAYEQAYQLWPEARPQHVH